MSRPRRSCLQCVRLKEGEDSVLLTFVGQYEKAEDYQRVVRCESVFAIGSFHRHCVLGVVDVDGGAAALLFWLSLRHWAGDGTMISDTRT